MERGLVLFDWGAKRKWKEEAQAQNNSDSRQEQDDEVRTLKRGIGFAVGCHGNGVFGAHRDFIALRLKMNDDGTFVLESGTHDMGNALITSQQMILAEELGVEPGDIAVVEADTDATPWNLGDYSSRGVFVTGGACLELAGRMRAKILAMAADLLDEAADALRLEAGRTVRAPDGRSASFEDILLHAHREHEEDLCVFTSYGSKAGRTSFGAHFAQVEVDTTSGEVHILDYVAVHDVGRAINRLSLEGQLEGGVQMGLGYALSEEMTFDERGRLHQSTLKRYRMYTAPMMPDIRLDFVEEGEDPGPYGGKSIGECATVPVAPAVVNAVCDALDHDAHTMPLTPGRVLEILRRDSSESRD